MKKDEDHLPGRISISIVWLMAGGPPGIWGPYKTRYRKAKQTLAINTTKDRGSPPFEIFQICLHDDRLRIVVASGQVVILAIDLWWESIDQSSNELQR